MKPANDMMPEILRSRDHDIAVLMKALAEERAEIDRLRAAGSTIIKANDEFRSGLPTGWDGDPVNDACEAARSLFCNEQAEANKDGA